MYKCSPFFRHFSDVPFLSKSTESVKTYVRTACCTCGTNAIREKGLSNSRDRTNYQSLKTDCTIRYNDLLMAFFFKSPCPFRAFVEIGPAVLSISFYYFSIFSYYSPLEKCEALPEYHRLYTNYCQKGSFNFFTNGSIIYLNFNNGREE